MFNFLIIALAVINTLFMAMTHWNMESWVADMLHIMNLFFVAAFIVEMIQYGTTAACTTYVLYLLVLIVCPFDCLVTHWLWAYSLRTQCPLLFFTIHHGCFGVPRCVDLSFGPFLDRIESDKLRARHS